MPDDGARWSDRGRTGHGDYATNVALQLAKKAGRRRRASSPSCVAERLRRPPGIAVGRGRRARASSTSASTRRRAGRSWPRDDRRGRARRTARTDALAGQQINLEFVSANPTGPVHLGGARWAAVGDALARLLRGRPAPRSRREYYFNDARRADRPVRRARCWPRATGEPAPEDGYGGEYIAEIAAQVVGRAARACSTCPTTRRRRSSGPRASS